MQIRAIYREMAVRLEEDFRSATSNAFGQRRHIALTNDFVPDDLFLLLEVDWPLPRMLAN